MKREKPDSKKDKDLWLSAMEYQAKFLLDPNLEYDGVDYSHIDKNLAIADLQKNPRLKIDEPERARSILRGLHVLNNPRYQKEAKKEVLVGFRDVERDDGSILRKPVFQEKKVDVPVFEKSFHKLRSKFLSFTNTSASRSGHRMKAAITNRTQSEQSIIDKTERKSGFFNFGGRSNRRHNYDEYR